MEVPAYIVEGLNAINGGLEVKWNPKAKMISPGSIDALGNVIQPVFEPRWEVWQQPDGETSQKFCTWQNTDGSFRPLSEQLLVHLRFINPERFGGDLTKLIAACTDEPQHMAELARENEVEDAFEMAAKWAYWKLCPKTKLPAHKAKGIIYSGSR